MSDIKCNFCGGDAGFIVTNRDGGGICGDCIEVCRDQLGQWRGRNAAKRATQHVGDSQPYPSREQEEE